MAECPPLSTISTENVENKRPNYRGASTRPVLADINGKRIISNVREKTRVALKSQASQKQNKENFGKIKGFGTQTFKIFDETEKESSSSDSVSQLIKLSSLDVGSDCSSCIKKAKDIFNLKEDLCNKENEYNSSDLIWSSPYRQDIYLYLKELQHNFCPRPTYMSKQEDINMNMRTVLVDWLIEVGEEYKLQEETLYLGVSFIDRFLSRMSVLRSKLQLVGTASLFIAAKYEEIYPPELKDFVYITDDTYTKRQVLRMEHLILKVLSFDVAAPTAYSFLRLFCCMCSASDTILYLAQFICGLSLLEADPFLKFLPSEIAASSLALSNYTLGYDVWPQELEELSGYGLNDLKPIVECLYNIYSTISMYPQKAIYEKFKSHRYLNVASIDPPADLSL